MSQPRQELLELRERLRQELQEARAAMPAHTVRPWQFQRLEQAEEALAAVEAQIKRLD